MSFKETPLMYADKLGDRLYEFVEERMTNENGCKREVTKEDEEDFGGECIVAWMFTQKGQRIYETFKRRLEGLFHKKYPYELTPDFDTYSGVIYP